MSLLARSFCLTTLLIVVTSADAATVIVDVSGTFDEELWQNTAGGGKYPFPGIFGGSFEGSFSFDSNGSRGSTLVERFDLFDVDISVFAEDGTLLDRIGDYPGHAEFREFNWNQGTAYIGRSGGISDRLQDLRLTFEYNTTVGDGRLSLKDFFEAAPAWGFIETDSPRQVSGFLGWNVQVDSFDFAVSTPEPDAVSLLLAAAVVHYAIRRRHLDRQPVGM